MARRGIREFHAKKILSNQLPKYGGPELDLKCALVTSEGELDALAEKEKWLRERKLVVKPDQLFGKRGKNKLVLLDANLAQAKEFVKKNAGRTVTVGKTTGKLTHFLVEPFVPHKNEYYVAIKTERVDDAIYFSTEGGIEVEENWDRVVSLKVPIGGPRFNIDVKDLLKDVQKEDKTAVENFIKGLYELYSELGFSYMEINPFTIVDGKAVPLDLVARIDDTSAFENESKWGEVEFPAPFGRVLTKEEKLVAELDEKSGASLKLTILNPKGRVWTMVAGGGASVIYADTIADFGFAKELANYGEYSGNPSEDETRQYAETILDLITREKDPGGKILIVGGGIANFTDVAKTFKGIVTALRNYREKLKAGKVKIYVRRGGPNYQKGLELMQKLGEELGIPIEVYGPETHMTRVVSLGLKERKSPKQK